MQTIDILALAGLRIDGRRSTDLRSLKHKLSVVKTADGSAYLEQGLNKVVVMVHGPQESKRRLNEQLTGRVSYDVPIVSFGAFGTQLIHFDLLAV
jgi:ribonuclease PH